MPGKTRATGAGAKRWSAVLAPEGTAGLASQPDAIEVCQGPEKKSTVGSCHRNAGSLQLLLAQKFAATRSLPQIFLPAR